METIERMSSVIKRIDGYGEVRFQRKNLLTMILRNGVPEAVNPGIDMGGSIRVLLPGCGWGFAAFNSIDDIERSTEDAICASKAIVPDEAIRIADVEPVITKISDELTDDFREHSMDEKYRLLEDYDGLIAGRDARIVERMLRYREEFSELYMLTTEGTRIERFRADGTIRCIVRATDGKQVQAAHQSFATRHSFADIAKRQKMIEDVIATALGLVEAKGVEGGIYTTVLDPALAGVFIHEAFGHLSEADHIEENPQAQEMMQLGRRFGPDFLNVYDDGGIMPSIRGTILYDDEGVSAEKTYLIKEGILVGRLHSRQTAAKLNEKPTGNARAEDYRCEPIVRMSNTAIEAGPHKAQKIFEGIEKGIYAIDAYGGQTELENFSFSAGHAFMIRNGAIAEMVRDVVLQGNLFETLNNIEGIADDFSWDTAGGYCGKDGQWAPTTEGSPHVRIKDVMIAG